MVSRLNLGAHLLSKVHTSDFLNDTTTKNTLQSFYASKVVRKEEFDKLPTFYVKNESFNICLGCKRSYTTDSIRKEKRNHFENHPECCEPFRSALTTLCAPKEDSNDTSQAELAALRLENRRLKEQLAAKPKEVSASIPVEETEEYKELERDNDETFKKFRDLRDIVKDLMGDKLNTKLDWSAQLFDIKEYVEKLKQPLEVKEEPEETKQPSKAAPKVNQSKVEAYVAANIAHDLKAQNEIGPTLSTADFEEASKRVKEYFTKPKEAPKAAPLAPPKAVFENSILAAAPILKTTRMLPKQVGAPRPQQLVPAR
jgi:hypothetical protein